MAEAILSVLGNFGFLLIVLFFITMDLSTFNNRLAVSKQYLRPRRSGHAIGSFVQGTRNYLVVSTVFGAIVAVIDAVALALLGLPSVVLWGLISFVTNYIPNIGFILGVIPPALIGLLQGGPQLMIAVIVVYSGINFVIQSLIQPRVGRRLGKPRHHGDFAVDDPMDVDHRSAGSAAGDPIDTAGAGGAVRDRPDHALDESAHRIGRTSRGGPRSGGRS